LLLRLGCCALGVVTTAADRVVPIFRRLLASRERSLMREVTANQPDDRIREIEVARIQGELLKAEELSDDVAAAIERAL
jgi:hypothetical protein